MKHSDLQSILQTDLRSFVHRLCLAMCPPRASWPVDHLDEAHAYEAGNVKGAYPVSASVLWGNSVFWTPTWGRTAGIGNEPPETQEESLAESDRLIRLSDPETDHAVGQG